jgi:hypothetical protein
MFVAFSADSTSRTIFSIFSWPMRFEVIRESARLATMRSSDGAMTAYWPRRPFTRCAGPSSAALGPCGWLVGTLSTTLTHNRRMGCWKSALIRPIHADGTIHRSRQQPSCTQSNAKRARSLALNRLSRGGWRFGFLDASTYPATKRPRAAGALNDDTRYRLAFLGDIDLPIRYWSGARPLPILGIPLALARGECQFHREPPGEISS